jgi:hypothetical protein
MNLISTSMIAIVFWVCCVTSWLIANDIDLKKIDKRILAIETKLEMKNE